MKTMTVLMVAAVAAGNVWASFGPLSPSAAPYEREYIWPEDRMPDDLDRIPCNVQWAVAIYPAYALTDGCSTR